MDNLGKNYGKENQFVILSTEKRESETEKFVIHGEESFQKKINGFIFYWEIVIVKKEI